MHHHEHQELIDRRYRTLLIVCGAVFAALPIYCAVAAIVLQQNETGIGGDGLPPVVPVVLAATGVSSMLAAGWISSLILGRVRATGTSPEARVDAFVQAAVVGFAVRESAGVFGLVISLLTGDLRWVLGLCGLAAVAMAAAWPRRDRLVDLVSAP